MLERLNRKLGNIPKALLEYRLLFFFVAAIAYLELIYRLWSFKGLTFDYFFPVVFALSAGVVLFIISGILPIKVNKIMAVSLTLLLCIIYSIQLIYYNIFQTPMAVYSLVGTGEVMQFGGIITSAILKNLFGVILLFVPLILLLIFRKKFEFFRIKPIAMGVLLLFGFVCYSISILCVNLTGESLVSQRVLYFEASSPVLSVSKLGLLTTMRLDVERLVVEYVKNVTYKEENPEENSATEPCLADNTGNPSNSSIPGFETPVPGPTKVEPTPITGDNVMDIDFNTLIENEKDSTFLSMHKYFSTVTPTKKNEYTGLFKGNNLILITAEAFSPYAIDPVRTPTLYKMATEGFVFNRFYNPVWGVSTSDGEYIACTGLIPKSGVWSFAHSAENYLPFVLGNQFKALGYPTRAYHDHSYTYYKRNLSHPNMGYDFKAVGKGLELKKTWPESDLEMINVTAGDYIGQESFHTYYMTVSGHMNYSFSGNYIAYKNKALVEGLSYSDPAKAYIACNLEFEFAMKALIEKLEAAGIADKTVIAISPDHYPYGLPRQCIDELAGHKVEDNFELYKSTFILWKKGMKPVTVDKPCASLDILPTLSNLFGLKYDSRLLMGRDILSDASPLVIFSNRSWITDRAMYNTLTNKAVFMDGTEADTAYVKAINKTVGNKFAYSAKILDTDYYRKIISKD